MSTEPRIWTLSDLSVAIRAAWGADTCDPGDLDTWHPGNPARGQCGVTALLVREVLGGDLMLGEIHVNGERTGYHYWNRLPDGTEVDLTREQLIGDEVVTAGAIPAGQDQPPRRCRGQWELFRHRVRGLVAPPTESGASARFAGVLLVDPDGAVLLDMNPLGAGVDPGQWSLPSVQVAAGDAPERAARRHLFEAMGLTDFGELGLVWHGTRPAPGSTPGGAMSLVQWTVYSVSAPEAAGAGLVDVDERTTRFVPADELATIDLGPSAAHVLWRVRTGPDRT